MRAMALSLTSFTRTFYCCYW